MIDRIQRQIEILYWQCGCRHDMKSSDVFGLGMETCDVVREEIEDCIQLLNISGKNTKKQVQEKLMMLIGGKMTGIEALKNLCERCERSKAEHKQLCPFRAISNDYCEEYEAFEKELKALEIIKRKEPDISFLLFNLGLKYYNDCVWKEQELTQEEYDLLMEVLR